MRAQAGSCCHHEEWICTSVQLGIFVVSAFTAVRNNSSPSQPGLPRGLSGKEFACPCRRHGRLGFDPGMGRSPGGGNGNPLQYSCVENSLGRGTWWATVHRAAELDKTERAHTHRCLLIITSWSFEQNSLSTRIPPMKSYLGNPTSPVWPQPDINYIQLGGSSLTRTLPHTCAASCMWLYTHLTKHIHKGPLGPLPTLYDQLMLAPAPIRPLAQQLGRTMWTPPGIFALLTYKCLGPDTHHRQRRGSKMRTLQELTKAKSRQRRLMGENILSAHFPWQWLHSSDRISHRMTLFSKIPVLF